MCGSAREPTASNTRIGMVRRRRRQPGRADVPEGRSWAAEWVGALKMGGYPSAAWLSRKWKVVEQKVESRKKVESRRPGESRRSRRRQGIGNTVSKAGVTILGCFHLRRPPASLDGPRVLR
jgi:hypothetical protein